MFSICLGCSRTRTKLLSSIQILRPLSKIERSPLFFTSTQISQITSEPNLQHLQNANVSEKMIKIIAKMLDKNPEKRPTAEECYKLIYQPK